jgi:Undecaprenyl-phosphate glucose phosphotransferase
MHERYSKFIRLIHLIGDLGLMNLVFFLAFYTVVPTPERALYQRYLDLAILLNLFWIFTVVFLRIYRIYRIARIEQVVYNMLKAFALHILLIFAIMVIFKAYYYSREFLLVVYGASFALIFVWRMVFIKMLKIYRKLGFNYRKVIIVGGGPVGQALLDFFRSDLSYGYQFVGFFDDHPERCRNPEMVLGDLDMIPDFTLENEIDEIYLALPGSADTKMRELIEFAESNMIRIKIIPDFMRYMPKKVTMDFYGSIPTVRIRKEPLESYQNRFVKRVFDIFFSMSFLVLIFSWLYPILAILIKLDTKGPVFFIQDRSGRRGEVFKCLKFRTMSVNSDSDSVQATKGDSRITRVGAFLRKTNLDELPQFINVLAGDMSVIGPRPHMLLHTEEYSKIISKFMVRHLIRPGITGWAQVNGFRGETKEAHKMQKRVQYDVWYIENWSFLLDIKIIYMTIASMLKGDKNAF